MIPYEHLTTNTMIINVKYAAATLALASLAAIPHQARAATFNVTVGGAGGVVAYDPQFVVCP